MNKAYVLQSISHAATQESYTNSFTAFPADSPFHPARVTPKPSIAGTQTAIVVGKQVKRSGPTSMVASKFNSTGISWVRKMRTVRVGFVLTTVGLGSNGVESSCRVSGRK